MKRVTLIKTSNEIQLAHLYEHLYLMAIVKYFKAHNLFDYLDYWCFGKTYYGGLIHLDIHLYTPEAEKLAHKLINLNPSFEQESIKGALVQMISEKSYHLDGKNIESIKSNLLSLHDQRWQTMDSVTVLPSVSRRSRKLLWETDTKAQTRQLACELSLELIFAKKNKNLLPLFDVVAHALLDNLSDELTDHFYYHMVNTSSNYTVRSAKRVHLFRGWLKQAPKLTNELEVCKSTLNQMFDRDIVKRITHFLRTSNYETTEAIFTLPDELKLYETTGFLIGAAGWQQLATEQNIITILKYTQLRLIYGREVQEVKFSEFS